MKLSTVMVASIGVSIITLFSNCGPSKKLVATRAHVEQLQEDSIYNKTLLSDCNMAIKILNGENKFAKQDLKKQSAASTMTISDQARRLKALQSVILEQNEEMNIIKNQMADALLNYSNDELEVSIKDGKVYVSLQEKLLFKSGSDEVDPKGKEALKALAMVLNKTTKISVLIEGHTDNVPINTKDYEDNWALSTARASSIVRILTGDNKFAPERISASGRGQYQPVKTNDTEIGRASNRRTEVILSPDLKEMFEVIE